MKIESLLEIERLFYVACGLLQPNLRRFNRVLSAKMTDRPQTVGACGESVLSSMYFNVFPHILKSLLVNMVQRSLIKYCNVALQCIAVYQYTMRATVCIV